MDYKNLIRLSLNYFHLDLTKNLEYDRLTKLIMKKSIGNNSNCLDVGCHKGEILDIIIKQAPNGKHFGFEPLPFLYNKLLAKYKNKATILPFALADKNGISTFQYVKNAPAYSGIKKRRYDISEPKIEEIEVELKKLDDVIPSDIKIDFIKIDVEGAEFGVLKGGLQLIKRDKPVVVFEFGLGASDFYGTKPVDLFNFFTIDAGLKLSLLSSYINGGAVLNLSEFTQYFNENKEYYFIAYS